MFCEKCSEKNNEESVKCEKCGDAIKYEHKIKAKNTKTDYSNSFEYFLTPYKKYAEFSGRASRKEFWMFILFYFLIAFILSIIDNHDYLENTLSNIFSVVSFIPYLALAVRRVHDVNKSGWFILIPFYNLFLVLTKSDTEENRFG